MVINYPNIEPAVRKEENTQAKKKIVGNNNKITKAINKNIEKTMKERAVTSKERFNFLK